MQINNNNNRVSFSSTILPYNKVPFSKPFELIDSFFELKGFANTNAAKVRAHLKNNQAGVILSDPGIILVGKDREADEFIARQIANANLEHSYIQDTPVTKFDTKPLDLMG